MKSSGLKRNNNECYYTNEDIAKLCVSKVKNIETYKKIIEPSAGAGIFLKFLPQSLIEAYDIDPKNENIVKMDYLTTDFNQGKILVIGNPPFGRQSSLAKKFIKHSCKFAQTIAFILPKSFKKESMYNCFDLYFHKSFQIELPKNSFNVDNQPYDVPCVFQIWERQDFKRMVFMKKTEKGYTFTKTQETCDVIFKRVGWNAGTFYTNNETNFSPSSHYFIKFDSVSVSVNVNIKDLNCITWESATDTIGSKSISKQELIVKLNEYTTNTRIFI